MSSDPDCGCGRGGAGTREAAVHRTPVVGIPHNGPEFLQKSASDLSARMVMWRAYAGSQNHNPCAARTPGKRWKTENDQKICDVGDMVLFNALLGYSGEMAAIDAVRRSQDNDGRWWRSPMHVDAGGNPTSYPGSKYSFSKDHTLGVLLYFVTTPDRETARGQARAWLHYMQKQGQIWDKLRIGLDIPETIGRKIAKSLQKCADGLMADGCAVRETITTVKDVWEKVSDCIRNPRDCWAKVKKEVQEDIDREIGYWTHNVCPEASLATCTVSPGLWFLFHRVWRDSLGLAPSANMRFADVMFSDSSYDEFVAWEASGKDGKPHLAAVNGLVRAILGKPASMTISTVYRSDPENPFYQFLMHKFVNNNLHPTEDIRKHLLAIAPSKIEEYDKTENGHTFKWFRNEDGTDNAGNQWAWERENVSEAVRDTMGWDCVFIGNLLVREFQVELDYYMQNVLPDLLRDRKRILNQTLSKLAESYGLVQRAEAGLEEFIEKAVAVIRHPDVTFAELEQLNRNILERYRKACMLNLQQLYADHSAARAAYESMLRLKEESRRKFQDAERLAEFGEIWGPQMVAYADTEEQLHKVQLILEGKTACLKLVQLLAAIPLRIEHEKINGTNQSLREIEEQIVADLRQAAKDLEYDRIKTELNWTSAQLAEQLRHHRIRRRYNSATEIADEIADQFQIHFARITNGGSLLNDSDLSEIRHEAVQIIERERQEWKCFVAEFGLKQIVLGRLQVLNAGANRQFERIQGYSQEHMRALYFQWRLRAEEAGYRTSQECRNAGAHACRQLSCWQFKAPADLAPRDEWVLFDVVLDGIERLIADFSSIGQPRDSETAHAPKRRQLPTTGVLFDVQAEGTCSERVQTPDGLRFRGCRIPQHMELQAAAVSPSGGNSVIESLTYFNRVVILANGESLYPSSVTWNLNGRRGDQALQLGGKVDVDVPVPYGGAVLQLEGSELNEWNVFKPGTKVEVEINYVYPDVRALKVYASTLGKYTRFLARVHRDLAPGNAQAEVIASLDEGIEVLSLLLDREDLDAITRRQIESAKKRMTDGKALITQACSTGGPDFCTAQIRTVRESLSANIATAANELSSLEEFVRADIQRLTGIADDIQRQLRAILQDLATPGRISGAWPFHIWIPNRAMMWAATSEETRFIRGEEVTITLDDDAFFRQGFTRNEPRMKSVGNFFASGGYWEWETVYQTWECGTAEYGGMNVDFGGRGRPNGPCFNAGGCTDPNRKYIHVNINRGVCSYSTVADLHRGRGMRTLSLRAVIEFSARPLNRRQWMRERHDGKVVYQMFRCSQDASQAFHRVDYSDYTWKPTTLSVNEDIDLEHWLYLAQGIGGIGLYFDVYGGEVQFNRLTWQLLNPF